MYITPSSSSFLISNILFHINTHHSITPNISTFSLIIINICQPTYSHNQKNKRKSQISTNIIILTSSLSRETERSGNLKNSVNTSGHDVSIINGSWNICQISRTLTIQKIKSGLRETERFRNLKNVRLLFVHKFKLK